MNANWALVDRSSNQVVVEHLELATTFVHRFCGLQLRSPMPHGRALLIAPCSSIHTMWMRFAIDVAYFSSEGLVVDIVRNLAPWRIHWPASKATAVLETTAGHYHFQIGQQLAIAQVGEKTTSPTIAPQLRAMLLSQPPSS